MAARIVSLGHTHAAPPPVCLGVPRPTNARIQSWPGASGRRYVHSIYGLYECPPLPAASYVLVRRDERGACTALRVDIADSEAPTLNLAQVRQQAAQAGANEVHVHFDAASDAERRLVACDLRTELFGSLAAAAS